MPKSPAERAGIPLSSTAASAVPHPEDPAWKAWMGHVDAGRIGSPCWPTAPLHEAGRPSAPLLEAGRPPMTRAQLATLVRNEMVLTGRGNL